MPPSFTCNTGNYWTPLAPKQVHFTLPPQHQDTDSTTWRRRHAQAPGTTWHHLNARYTSRPNTSSSVSGTHLTQAQLKSCIFNGTIASAVSDTGVTSTAGAPQEPFHPGHATSTKSFVLPTGSIAKASTMTTLLLNIHPPANRVDIIPNLTQTLLNGSKFADAGYTASTIRRK